MVVLTGDGVCLSRVDGPGRWTARFQLLLFLVRPQPKPSTDNFSFAQRPTKMILPLSQQPFEHLGLHLHQFSHPLQPFSSIPYKATLSRVE